MAIETGTINSPMGGLVSLHYGLNGAPHVAVGSAVARRTYVGTVLPRNPGSKIGMAIRAGRRGRVVEVLVKHGDLVTTGQPLFRVESVEPRSFPLSGSPLSAFWGRTAHRLHG